MKHLPYRARTATGGVLDIDFPLHPDTGDATAVANIVSTLLETIDRHLALTGETSNGDVLQALTMVTAVRAGIIHAPHEQTAQLASELLRSASEAVAIARRHTLPAGRG